MSRYQITIADKPMYSIALERDAAVEETDERHVAELIGAMNCFAEAWIVPTRVEISVFPGDLTFADVTDVDQIAAQVARAKIGAPDAGVAVSWDGLRATLPPEVEPIESDARAISFVGSTEFGHARIKVGIYWSAWLQFPQLLDDAIERVLDRGTGWEQVDLKQVNHWLDRDDD